MKQERSVSPEARQEPAERRPGRRYKAPELEEYGSLKDLTRTLSTQSPGDGFGASYTT